MASAPDSAPRDTGPSRGSAGNSAGKPAAGKAANPARGNRAPAGGPGQPAFGQPNLQVKQTGPAWKVRPDGTKVFRMGTPLVLWWIWVVFALANLIDLAVQGRTWFDLQAGVAVLAITGAMYAGAFRPVVLTDADGITMYNPLRIHRISFGRVKGVYLGDSVEIVCGRPGKKDRTFYSWALYSSRRSRLRAANPRTSKRFTSRRMPDEAQALARQHTGHIMAEELARLVEDAHKAQAAEVGRVDGGVTDGSTGADLLPGADVPSANGKAGGDGSAAGLRAAGTDGGHGADAAAAAGSAEAAEDDSSAGLTGTLESRWDWPAVAILLVPVAALISVILVK